MFLAILNCFPPKLGLLSPALSSANVLKQVAYAHNNGPGLHCLPLCIYLD